MLFLQRGWLVCSDRGQLHVTRNAGQVVCVGCSRVVPVGLAVWPSSREEATWDRYSGSAGAGGWYCPNCFRSHVRSEGAKRYGLTQQAIAVVVGVEDTPHPNCRCCEQLGRCCPAHAFGHVHSSEKRCWICQYYQFIREEPTNKTMAKRVMRVRCSVKGCRKGAIYVQVDACLFGKKLLSRELMAFPLCMKHDSDFHRYMRVHGWKANIKFGEELRVVEELE